MDEAATAYGVRDRRSDLVPAIVTWQISLCRDELIEAQALYDGHRPRYRLLRGDFNWEHPHDLGRYDSARATATPWRSTRLPGRALLLAVTLEKVGHSSKRSRTGRRTKSSHLKVMGGFGEGVFGWIEFTR